MPIIYRINLVTPKITKELIGENHNFEFFAGRSLSSKIIAEEVPPKSDALSEKNKLVFASGFLSGTSTPNSGRLSVGSKSPLTGCVKESNVGGRAPAMLGILDIRALIIEGKASKWVILKIHDEDIVLKTIMN
jgi:aldehyde:ferredoxin oxidoreductase